MATTQSLADHRHFYIFQGRQRGQEIVQLEDKTNCLGAKSIDILQISQIFTCHAYLATGGLVERAEQVEQGALAAAAWPHDGKKFTRLNRQRNVIQRNHGVIACAVDFAQITRAD